MNSKHRAIALKRETTLSARQAGGSHRPVYLRTYGARAITPRSSGVSAPTDILLKPQPEVSDLDVQEVLNSAGFYAKGDMVFIIAASAVTEAQLNAATEIVYGKDLLRILERDAHMDVFRSVQSWRVVAGVRQ